MMEEMIVGICVALGQADLAQDVLAEQRAQGFDSTNHDVAEYMAMSVDERVAKILSVAQEIVTTEGNERFRFTR